MLSWVEHEKSLITLALEFSLEFRNMSPRDSFWEKYESNNVNTKKFSEKKNKKNNRSH